VGQILTIFVDDLTHEKSFER